MAADGTVKRVLAVATRAHRQLVDITERVQAMVGASGVREGRCVLFVPHTTAGLTINENDDPDVPRDMLTGLTDLLGDESRFRHYEGNAGRTPALLATGCLTHHLHCGG